LETRPLPAKLVVKQRVGLFAPGISGIHPIGAKSLRNEVFREGLVVRSRLGEATRKRVAFFMPYCVLPKAPYTLRGRARCPHRADSKATDLCRLPRESSEAAHEGTPPTTPRENYF